MPRQQQIDPAAQVALLVAKASVARDDGVVFSQFRVLPGTGVVSEPEAAAQLASMPKPTRCRAQAADGVLVLECGPLTPAEARSHEETAPLRRRLAPVGERGHAALVKNGTDLLRVVGRDGSILLHSADFERFERDFLIVNPFMASGGPPASGTGPAKPGWIVEYGPFGEASSNEHETT
jgi:hypothetical protein